MKKILPFIKKCTKISTQKTDDLVLTMHTADSEELT